MSRRHLLSLTGLGRLGRLLLTMLLANPTLRHDLSTDALCHVDGRFAPKHAKRTPTLFLMPNKKPQPYCFPNGEVFRPRNQPHKRQRPGKVPRANLMTNVPLAGHHHHQNHHQINNHYSHHLGYSLTPGSSTRLPRNNSFLLANTSFLLANTTFTSRDNLIKSIRLQRSDTYTNLAPDQTGGMAIGGSFQHPPPLAKLALVPRMQPTNILRIESSDSIVQMSHMLPLLQLLPEGLSMRYSLALVLLVEDHLPALSHLLSMRLNSNTPLTSIDGVEVTKELEPLCPLPEHKEPSLDLSRDARPHLPYTVPATDATANTTIDNTFVDALESIPLHTMALQSLVVLDVWLEGEEVSVVLSPHSTTDTDKQATTPSTPTFAAQFAAHPPPVPQSHPQLPPLPRSPDAAKFHSLLTSKASQVFEKDLSSSEDAEQKIIDALQNDTTVPPRGDLALYLKLMQSLVSFDTFDDAAPKEALAPQTSVSAPVPAAVPIAEQPTSLNDSADESNKNAGHSQAQPEPEPKSPPSKANMPRSRLLWGLNLLGKLGKQLSRLSSKSNLRSMFRKIFRKSSDKEAISEDPQPSPPAPQTPVQSRVKPQPTPNSTQPQQPSPAQTPSRGKRTVEVEPPIKPELLTLTRLPLLEPQISGMDDVLRDIDEYGSLQRNKLVRLVLSRHDPFVFDDELTEDQIADQKARDKLLSMAALDPLDASDAEDSYVDENILALREEYATNKVDLLIDFGNIYSTHRVDGPVEVMVVHRDQLDQVFSKFDATGPHRRRLGNLKYVQQLLDFNLVKMTVRKFDATVAPTASDANKTPRKMPSSLRSNRSRLNPRRVMFANTISVNETYSAEAYPRVNRLVTQYTITNPTEISRIKQELNQYKCEEMLVHELSQENTHFFYP